jgi:hypothetical protein
MLEETGGTVSPGVFAVRSSVVERKPLDDEQEHLFHALGHGTGPTSVAAQNCLQTG